MESNAALNINNKGHRDTLSITYMEYTNKIFFRLPLILKKPRMPCYLSMLFLEEWCNYCLSCDIYSCCMTYALESLLNNNLTDVVGPLYMSNNEHHTCTCMTFPDFMELCIQLSYCNKFIAYASYKSAHV